MLKLTRNTMYKKFNISLQKFSLIDILQKIAVCWKQS